MTRRAVAGAGGQDGAVRTQHRRPDLEAAATPLAVRIPELVDGAAGSGPGVGCGIVCFRIRSRENGIAGVGVNREYLIVRKQVPAFFVEVVVLAIRTAGHLSEGQRAFVEVVVNRGSAVSECDRAALRQHPGSVRQNYRFGIADIASSRRYRGGPGIRNRIIDGAQGLPDCRAA